MLQLAAIQLCATECRTQHTVCCRLLPAAAHCCLPGPAAAAGQTPNQLRELVPPATVTSLKRLSRSCACDELTAAFANANGAAGTTGGAPSSGSALTVRQAKANMDGATGTGPSSGSALPLRKAKANRATGRGLLQAASCSMLAADFCARSGVTCSGVDSTVSFLDDAGKKAAVGDACSGQITPV